VCAASQRGCLPRPVQVSFGLAGLRYFGATLPSLRTALAGAAPAALLARPRVGASKIKLARDGAKFFVIILKIVTIFSPMKIFLPVSIGAFLLGVAYGAWTVVFSGRIANGAVLLLMFAVIVFLVGLVSEQISALRFEGRS